MKFWKYLERFDLTERSGKSLFSVVLYQCYTPWMLLKFKMVTVVLVCDLYYTVHRGRWLPITNACQCKNRLNLHLISNTKTRDWHGGSGGRWMAAQWTETVDWKQHICRCSRCLCSQHNNQPNQCVSIASMYWKLVLALHLHTQTQI